MTNDRNNPQAGQPLRCLVTGGLGYAGAWICDCLAQKGHTLFIVSRKNEKPNLGFPYTLVCADLAELSPAAIAAKLPEPPDSVIHAASYNEAFDPDYPRKALLANALGTRNLLEALTLRCGANTPLPLFIYLSTFHVYGRNHGHIDENTPVRPRNDYALTHLFGEEYCRMFAATRALPHIILRISNGYGAPKTQQSTKWYLLLNDLCKKAVETGELVLHSSPSTRRDFVWLGDLAAVVEKLLHNRDLAGSVFNVASGKSVSIGDVATLVSEAAADLTGKQIPVSAPPTASGENSEREFALMVSNDAVRQALDVRFHNRMREEISLLLRLASSR